MLHFISVGKHLQYFSPSTEEADCVQMSFECDSYRSLRPVCCVWCREAKSLRRGEHTCSHVGIQKYAPGKKYSICEAAYKARDYLTSHCLNGLRFQCRKTHGTHRLYIY